jgi:hypothetical protein
MQKILVLILAILSSGLIFNMGYAEDQKIFTSEMVPGATCWCIDDKGVREDSA